MLNVATLRRSYSSGELESIGHVLREYNLADPLTKKMKSDALDQLMINGTITHPVNMWIIHKPY